MAVALVAIAIGTALASQAAASTITTSQNLTGYTVLSDDLLQTDLSSTNATSSGTYTFTQEGVLGVSTLTDGGFGSLGGANAQGGVKLAAATAGWITASNTIVYTFDATVNIASINTYAGWDAARYQQAYDVYVHYVGDAAGTFTEIASVTYQPTSLGSTNCTKVTISDLGTTANGVDQIEFVFNKSDPNNGYSGYREIDVVGTAVPEPSTTALGLMGAAGALICSWRRRRRCWRMDGRRMLAEKHVWKTLLAVVAMFAADAAHASTITYGTSTTGSDFTVSNTDLLQTAGSLSFKGTYDTGVYEGCGTTKVLTDGAFGTKGTSAVGQMVGGSWTTISYGTHSSTCLIYTNSTATYTLDTSVNTAGYDISNINIFSSWSDTGRCQLNVVVLYSTVADPTTFITIGTATSGSTSVCNAAYITTNLTGVKAIEFVFPTQQNGYAGYNELDVIGTASVPEPSTTALGLMGMLSLFAYGWRRRALRAGKI